MHLIHRPLPDRKEGFGLKYKFGDRLAAAKLYLERQRDCPKCCVIDDSVPLLAGPGKQKAA